MPGGAISDFLTHLAASLQAGRGYAAAGVDDAYAKARTACERAGTEDRLVLVGLEVLELESFRGFRDRGLDLRQRWPT